MNRLWRSRGAGLVLILWASAIAPAAAPPAWAVGASVLGTVHAKVGNAARTWYVLTGGDVSGATITRLGPGLFSVVIVAFESKDVKLSRNPATGALAAAGTGSQITISFRYSERTSRASYRLPDDGKASAAVMLIPSVEDVTVMNDMAEGRLAAAAIKRRGAEIVGFRGKFSGALTNRVGEPVATVTDGSFRVDGFEKVEPDPSSP